MGLEIIFVLGVIASVEAPRNWEDVKVGDCLSIAELQELSGVVDADLYFGESCGQVHPTEGVFDETNTCGAYHAGTWTRSMLEHDEAGFWWPNPVPCTSSVKELSASHTFFEDPEDLNICADTSSLRILSQQTESMHTKEFGAGQGSLHLPDPILVERISYAYLVDEILATCHSAEARMRYDGWGKLSGEVKRWDCFSGLENFCKSMKMQASSKPDGQSCVLIKKLTDC